ncbi:Nuclear transport factor 2 [Taenia solium]|eukprot:TsM_000144000 transcript=TsM_000144000 gene=TsM_000144000
MDALVFFTSHLPLESICFFTNPKYDRRVMRMGHVAVYSGHLDAITYIGSRNDDRYFLSNSKDRTDMALMTYEGTKIQGKQAIAKHFQSLCWTTIAVNVSTCDCQPVDNGYLVFVNGQLKVDNGEQALPFSEFFLLKKVGDRVVILHSMFRLHFHNF